MTPEQVDKATTVAKKNMPYTGVPKDCIIKATWKKSAKTD